MDQNQHAITAFNKTALVEIFIWIPLSLSFLSVVARLATKLAILGRLQLEDHFIFTALVRDSMSSSGPNLGDESGLQRIYSFFLICIAYNGLYIMLSFVL